METVFICQDLNGVSSFNADIKLLKDYKTLVVKKIDFYGAGTDNTIYLLYSDLVNGKILDSFKESRGVGAFSGNIYHRFGTYSSNGYNFIIKDVTGALQSLTGELVIVLEFSL